MANAPDPVKSIADIVVPSNDEDGVAAALEMLPSWSPQDSTERRAIIV